MKTLIMKFGGASVATAAHFSSAAEVILSRKKEFENVVVVVSAMGDTTDTLLGLAKEVHPSPPGREVDMLVSVGERIAISLLAMALERKGCEAISLTGSQSGILTTGSHFEAKIITVRPRRILKHLKEGKVVIVAGFQGVSSHGEITTLGRGGSDTSAVALGVSLGAEKVEFFKDVDGIYSRDPKILEDAVKFSLLDYGEALNLMEGQKEEVLHSRAIALAAKNKLPLHVLSFKKALEEGTLIASLKEKGRRKEPAYESEE